MWVHVQRLSRPATYPPRALAWGTLAALTLLSLVRPVASAAPADLARAPGALALDWFYLGVHAFADATSPAALWLAAGGLTLLLLALPWVSRAARAPRPTAAVVDLAQLQRLRTLLRRLPVRRGHDALAHRRPDGAAAGGGRSDAVRRLRHLRRRVPVVDAVSLGRRARDRHRHAAGADRGAARATRRGTRRHRRRARRFAHPRHRRLRLRSGWRRPGSRARRRRAHGDAGAARARRSCRRRSSTTRCAPAPTACSSPAAATAIARTGSATAGSRRGWPARASRTCAPQCRGIACGSRGWDATTRRWRWPCTRCGDAVARMARTETRDRARAGAGPGFRSARHRGYDACSGTPGVTSIVMDAIPPPPVARLDLALAFGRYTLALPRDGRMRLALGWFALGVAALAASGILAILLVLSRTPGLARLFPVADFFLRRAGRARRPVGARLVPRFRRRAVESQQHAARAAGRLGRAAPARRPAPRSSPWRRSSAARR